MIILKRLAARNFKALRAVDLIFPEKATILIEGWNESGKSTLFEAIAFALYGEPLIKEDTTGSRGGRNESAIHFQEEEAVVQLDLAIGATTVRVERRLSRTGAKARLIVQYPGKKPEPPIQGPSAVTARVIQEMGGLTRDMLLNSCFVEQHHLGRLEEMSPADRQKAIESLLNLANLQRLQRDFAVSHDDERDLDLARRRLDVAELGIALNHSSLALAQAQHRQARQRVQAIRAEALTEAAQIAQWRASLEHIRHEQAALATRAGQIAELQAAQAQARDLAALAAEDARSQRDAADLTARIAECDAAREQLLQIAARRQALQALNADVHERRQVSERRASFQQIAGQLDRRENLEREIAAQREEARQAKAALGGAEAAFLAAVERQETQRWLQGAEALARSGASDADLARARQATSQAEAAHAAAVAGQAQKQRSLLLLIGAAVIVLAASVWAVAQRQIWGAILLLAAAGLGWAAWRASREQTMARALAATGAREMQSAQQRVMQMTAQAQAMRDLGGGAHLQEDAARALREHGLAVPADPATTRTRLAGMAAPSASLRDLQSGLDAARRQQAEAAGRLDALAAQLADLAVQAHHDPSDLAQDIAHMTEMLADLDQRIAEASAALQVTPEIGDVGHAIGAVTAEMQQIQGMADLRSNHETALARVTAERTTRQARAATLWHDLRAAAPDLGLEESCDLVAAADVLARIEDRLHAAGDGEWRANGEDLARQQGQIERDITAADDRIRQDRAAIARDLAGLHLVVDPDDDALDTPAIPEIPENAEELAERVRVLEEENVILGSRVGEGLREFGGQIPTPEECHADTEKRAHEIAVRRVAAGMLEQARRRIVEQVLPSTEHNMALLLPQLTMGRYHSCTITEEYKIQIFDETAGRDVAKSLFSGGARDQFSLALRLAFALATLPQELGTAPGFIVLDEPLSSFDGQRSQAWWIS